MTGPFPRVRESCQSAPAHHGSRLLPERDRAAMGVALSHARRHRRRVARSGDRELPIHGDRIGVSGHSRGCHGALVLALRDPEPFRTVSAFAPIAAPSHVPRGMKAFTRYLGAERARGRVGCLQTASQRRQRGVRIDPGRPLALSRTRSRGCAVISEWGKMSPFHGCRQGFRPPDRAAARAGLSSRQWAAEVSNRVLG